MDDFIFDCDFETTGDIIAGEEVEAAHFFIVVAGQIGDFCAFVAHADECFQHFCAFFCPVPAFVEFPAVNDITNQVEMLAAALF